MRTPKRLKFRTLRKLSYIPKLKKAKNGYTVTYGTFGLISKEPGVLTSRQQEAGRKVIARRIKKLGRFYMNIFPDRPRTKHSTGTKMGMGKGKVEDYVAVINAGLVLYEITGPEIECREALKMVGYKMPFKTSVVTK